MYIGIDLGTSGVKVILLGEQGQLLASQSEPLPISRPHPLWSEQDPQDWWQATDRAMLALAKQHSLQQVKAIGLTGQMHGATLLDRQQRVLRPPSCGTMAAALRNARHWNKPYLAHGKSPVT